MTARRHNRSQRGRRKRYDQLWIGGHRVDNWRPRARKAVTARVRKATRPLQPQRKTWNRDRAVALQRRGQARQLHKYLAKAAERLEKLHTARAAGWSRLADHAVVDIRLRVLAIPDAAVEPRWNDERHVWEIVGDVTGVITRVGQRKGAHAQLLGHALGDLQALLAEVDRLDAECAGLAGALAAAEAAASSCSCGGGS